MKILFFGVGQKAEVKEIQNQLHSLQAEVKGYIETIKYEDYVIVVNEDGRCLGFPLNRKIGNVNIVGDFFICKFQKGEFCGLTVKDINYLKSVF